MNHLTLGPVGNVFFFAPELDVAVAWYEQLLGVPAERAMPQLAVWQLGALRLTLHAEDDFNARGTPATGTVPYFDVADVDAALALCVARGGVAHRGPKTVFSGERLLQVLDPFGNLLGLRQPPSAAG